MKFDRRILNGFDWPLVSIATFIPICGLVVLFSAGYDPDSQNYIFGLIPPWIPSPAFTKQIIFIVLGLGVCLGSMLISAQRLVKYAYAFYALCIFLLVAVVLFGTIIKGSKRWIDFGSIHFQPSEITKMGVILALARYLSRTPSPKGGFRLKQLILPCLIFVVPMGLILEQPDLGTGIVVGGIGFAMIAFAGIHLRSLLLVACIGLALIYPAWNSLHDYQKRRVMVLIDPEGDPLGSGYHILQSKIAVGSGELVGKGFLKGTQTQLQFLPEHSTDFIFSVLAEEWGFLGCILVLSLYIFLLYRLCVIIQKTRDPFATFLVVGLTAHIFCHVFINVGMVVGLLPVVGIPLPLFSYGGSALLSNMLAIGLALGVSVRRRIYHH